MASLTVAAITFAAMGLRQYRRASAWRALANEAALRFSIDDPFDIPRRCARMLLMSGGHSLAAHNVTYGCLQDSSVRAFDFHYEAGHGTQRQTRRFDAALFELSRSRPQLLLWRDGGGWISPADADGSIGPWSYIGSRPLAQAVLGAGFDHAAPGACLQARGNVLLAASPAAALACGPAATTSSTCRCCAGSPICSTRTPPRRRQTASRRNPLQTAPCHDTS